VEQTRCLSTDSAFGGAPGTQPRLGWNPAAQKQNRNEAEQQVDDTTYCEATMEEEMAWALAFISQLETRISLLQERLSEGERKLVVKDALLRNAAVRERVLRAQVAMGSIVPR